MEVRQQMLVNTKTMLTLGCSFACFKIAPSNLACCHNYGMTCHSFTCWCYLGVQYSLDGIIG